MRIELAHEVIQGSFDEAVSHLELLDGGRMAKRQAEEVAVKLSQDFDAYYRQPLTLSVNNGATENILVISADGKGIVMHPDGLREATRKASEKAAGKMQTRLSPGEKGHRKRMATVVSVYEIAPYFRRPIQILDPLQSIPYHAYPDVAQCTHMWCLRTSKPSGPIPQVVVLGVNRIGMVHSTPSVGCSLLAME